MTATLIGLTGFAGAGKDTVADLLVTHARFTKLAFADALRAEIVEGFGIEPSFLTNPSTKHVPCGALSMRRAPRDFVAAMVLARVAGRRLPAVSAATHTPHPIVTRNRMNVEIKLGDISFGRISTDTNGAAALDDFLTHLQRHHADHPLSDEWLDAPRSPRQIMQWWGTEYRRAQDPRYWVRIMGARIAELQRDGLTRLVVTDVRFDNEAGLLRGRGGSLWQITRPNATGSAEGQHVSVTDGTVFLLDAVIPNIHDIRHLQGVVLAEIVQSDLGLPRGSVRVEMPA